MGLTSPSAPFKGERSEQALGSGVRTPGAQSPCRGQCPVRRSHPAQWQIWKRCREDRWSPSRLQGCPETQRCLTSPSARKATAQGPVRAGGSQTGRDPTQSHWAGRGPTQPPASGKSLLASLGCKRRVASPQMVSDAGHSSVTSPKRRPFSYLCQSVCYAHQRLLRRILGHVPFEVGHKGRYKSAGRT